MTPGQEALREAARLESARIYGRVLGQRDPVQAETPAEARPGSPEFRERVIALRRQGNSIAAIALQLGRSKDRISFIVHAHENRVAERDRRRRRAAGSAS